MKSFRRLFRRPKEPEHPQSLEVLSEGIDPFVDIVAVHGLNGHREKTWIADNGVHWLRDLLPSDIPTARIFSWGYDANTHATSGTSIMSLYDHARALVAELTLKRKVTNSSQRPIIFIAHSLGGIVVKSALIHSDAARQGALLEHRSIKISTYGIIFMGTPHQGGNGVQLGRIVANVASVFVPTDDRLFKHLERDSEWLLQQLGQYGPISGEFVTKFAYEEYPTPVAGKRFLVVPRASAVVPGHADAEPIAIHANHKNMVKFLSKDDVGYVTVSWHLQIMLQDAEGVVQGRWEVESRVDNARGNKTDFSLVFSLSAVNAVIQFTGRQEELVQMRKILTISHTRTTVVIHGLGGMGKTQLAIEFAKRNHARYSAVLWMNATNEETMKRSFLKVAERILQEHPDIPDLKAVVLNRDMDDTIKAVKEWLNKRNNSRWLIIYDNYDHPCFGSTYAHIDNAESQGTDSMNSLQNNGTVPNAFDIRPFFPETDHGAIVVTTRSSTVKLGHTIKLSKLKTIEDSLQILESTSNRKRLREDPGSIRLAQKLDGLPLALSTAGAYLDQVSITCNEYLEHYQASWYKLQALSPEILSYENRAMYSTWDISYFHVEKKNKSSAILLKLWAYFDHDDVWHGLLCGDSDSAPPRLQAIMDKLTFTESIRLLCDHGFVEAHPSSEEDREESLSYSVHGCVHAWMINVLNETTDMELATYAARCVAFLSVVELTHGATWRNQRRLLRHADRYLELTMESNEVHVSTSWILGVFGSLYSTHRKNDKARTVLERQLQLNEDALGLEHENTLVAVHDLGTFYLFNWQLDEAEAMFEDALHGYEKTRGPEHILKILGLFNDLGYLYQLRGQLDKAKDMHERAFRGYMKELGIEDENTLFTFNHLCQLYAREGQLDKAAFMLKGAVQAAEKILGPEHKVTLQLFISSGMLFWAQGQLDEARTMYELVLQWVEKRMGPEDKMTFDVIATIGIIYGLQGHLETAKDMLKRALRGYENLSGSIILKPYGPAAQCFYELGFIYELQRKPQVARQCYMRALEGYRAVYGDDGYRVKDISERLRCIDA